jgi:hypothetical protein
MKSITGAWELLPDHGSKPAAVKNAEQIEREIKSAKRSLSSLQKQHAAARDKAVSRILESWDAKEAAKALLNSHFWIAEEIARRQHPDGRSSVGPFL